MRGARAADEAWPCLLRKAGTRTYRGQSLKYQPHGSKENMGNPYRPSFLVGPTPRRFPAQEEETVHAGAGRPGGAWGEPVRRGVLGGALPDRARGLERRAQPPAGGGDRGPAA